MSGERRDRVAVAEEVSIMGRVSRCQPHSETVVGFASVPSPCERFGLRHPMA